MVILFAHSDEYVTHLLVEWLDFKAIARLDFACTFSCYDRTNLLKIFASKQAVFRRLPITNVRQRNQHGFLSWLLQRKIKLARVHITSELRMHRDTVDKYLKLCGLVVESLTLPSVKRSFEPINEVNGVLLPNIKELTVGGKWFSQSLLTSILQGASKLEHLTLELRGGLRYEEASGVSVGCHWPLLKYLRFGKEIHTSHVLSWLPFCAHVKSLSLARISFDKSQVVFPAIASYCPAIVTLNIEDGESSSGVHQEKVLEAFTSLLVKCPHLTDMRFFRCGFMSDKLLFAIAANAPWIVSLDLEECHISDLGLAQVAKHCTNLQDINYTVGGFFPATKDAARFFQRGTRVRCSECDDYECEPCFDSADESEGDDYTGNNDNEDTDEEGIDIF